MTKTFLVLPRSGQVCLVMHEDIANIAKLWSFIPGYDLVTAKFARYGQAMPKYAKIWPIHTQLCLALAILGHIMPSYAKVRPRYVQVCSSMAGYMNMVRHAKIWANYFQSC